MIRDVLISGRVSDRYEYFTTAVGRRLNVRLLYDGRAEPGDTYDRFYSGGSEVRVAEDGVSFSGTGGTFCSYMFGVDVPEKDLLRREVRNRLVLHGARYVDAEERLTFSSDTGGFDSWARIFHEGHAFANYYFFVDLDQGRSIAEQQERILRAAGRYLKRYDLASIGRDGHTLALDLHEAIGVPDWTLFVVKIIDLNAEEYFNRFRTHLEGSRSMSPEGLRSLDRIAVRLDVDAHRRERIGLEVIYTHADNKRLIDQYKDALAQQIAGVTSDTGLVPRLNLIRAFSARHAIPAAIFDRLDSLATALGSNRTEPVFLAEARSVLDRLFVEHVGAEFDRDALVRLLRAKRESLDRRFVGFEAVLLSAAHAADEWEALGRGTQLRARFEQIVHYFDLLDASSALVNSLAHVDDFELTTDRLESLLESRQIFDELEPDLFDGLFLAPLASSQYLDIYGRRKLAALRAAFAKESSGNVADLLGTIRDINESARLHRLMDEILRGAIGNIHEHPLSSEDRQALRRDVESRLASDYGISATVSENLFDLVLLCIEEEYFYAMKLLPTIIATRDLQLREDFLKSSGLDRFRVEEIEAAYIRGSLPTVLGAGTGL